MTQVVRLGDVGEFIRGITFKPKDVVSSDTDGSVRCMRTKNVQDSIDLSDVWSVDARFVKRRSQYLRAGDILVSSANSWNLVGKCTWVPELSWPATFGGFVSVLRAHPSQVHPRYLYRWFSAPRTQATLRSFGRQTTSISNLDLKRTLNIELLLPDFTEQQRIAQILDEAGALLAKRRRSNFLLDDLASSVFQNMFGRGEMNSSMGKIESLSMHLIEETRNGLSPSKGGDVENLVLTLSAITGGSFDRSAAKKGTFKARPPESKRVDRRDFLVCRGNGNLNLVGLGCFPDDDMPEIVFPDTMIALRVDPDIIGREYLEHTWRSKPMRAQIEAGARTTNGTFKINQSVVESLRLLVPSIEKQKDFGEIIQTIKAVRKQQSRDLTELNELFASLQTRAFRGEL